MCWSRILQDGRMAQDVSHYMNGMTQEKESQDTDHRNMDHIKTHHIKPYDIIILKLSHFKLRNGITAS